MRSGGKRAAIEARVVAVVGLDGAGKQPTHSITNGLCLNTSPLHFDTKVMPRNDIDSHLRL
jgi:hypothetical protein